MYTYTSVVVLLNKYFLNLAKIPQVIVVVINFAITWNWYHTTINREARPKGPFWSTFVWSKFWHKWDRSSSKKQTLFQNLKKKWFLYFLKYKSMRRIILNTYKCWFLPISKYCRKHMYLFFTIFRAICHNNKDKFHQQLERTIKENDVDNSRIKW